MALVDQLRLMVLTDVALLQDLDPVAACARAVAGGVTAVQVRLPGATPRVVLALTRSLVAALPVPVLVNDRVDLALAAGAAGAHLGQDDVPLEAVRPWVPPGFVLGLSVGSVAEAERARRTPADYWSVGPCFPTGSKSDAGPPLGPAGFATIRQVAPSALPVIAIGGITAANAASVWAAGAVGVAVIAAIWGASDPAAAARALRSAVASPRGSPPHARPS
jgi:thiamine-phosphate pyrophosphorylase